MAILKELWSEEISDDQVLSTYQYEIDLRGRLEQTCKLAHDNLEKVQGKQNIGNLFTSQLSSFDWVYTECIKLINRQVNQVIFQYSSPTVLT